MELLIKNLDDILSKGISLTQRGILFTILSCKDKDSRITLAKFKLHIKLSEVKGDLIYLHKKGFIRWSGYKNAVEAVNKNKESPKVVEVIDFMNNLYSRKFDPKSSFNKDLVLSRLQDYDVEALKSVIANRWIAWKDDPVMRIHLTPSTIFRRSKFDKYYEDVLSTKRGTGLVAAEAINLSQGDEVVPYNVKTFIDSEVYCVKTYKTDKNGARKGNGVITHCYGRDLKVLINIEEMLIKNGGVRSNIYTYQKNN